LLPFPTQVKFLLSGRRINRSHQVEGWPPGHGDFHPVSWCQYYDGGRAFLTTLGHDSSPGQTDRYTGQEFFKQHIVRASFRDGHDPFCT
jgi:type 1 glutamine amidotransferase